MSEAEASAAAGVVSGPEDPESEPTFAAVKRVGLEILKLLATLLPEVVIFVLGAILGLVIGVVAGVSTTAQLFEGGGAWGHAGVIALILPILTFFGPTIMGIVIGAFCPLPFVIGIHALVLIPFERRDRHWVVFAVAIAYWLPFPIGLLTGGVAGGVTGVMIVGLVLAAVTLLVAIGWFAFRLLLRGRSLAAWWTHAGTSMLVCAILLTILGALVLWLVMVLFPFLPVAPFLLLGAIVLATRLVWTGHQRVPAVIVMLIAGLHLSALVAAFVLALRGE